MTRNRKVSEEVADVVPLICRVLTGCILASCYIEARLASIYLVWLFTIHWGSHRLRKQVGNFECALVDSNQSLLDIAWRRDNVEHHEDSYHINNDPTSIGRVWRPMLFAFTSLLFNHESYLLASLVPGLCPLILLMNLSESSPRFLHLGVAYVWQRICIK